MDSFFSLDKLAGVFRKPPPDEIDSEMPRERRDEPGAAQGEQGQQAGLDLEMVKNRKETKHFGGIIRHGEAANVLMKDFDRHNKDDPGLTE